ncbi:MAG TPA: 30S ribosomal protein S3 [Candidatus Angelobacter sp.]|jgi:small subunit ribosomal protein S3|nr:30S ribosomal protein S3 [Candidatus Angelobacter sp.]
MGHKVNPIGFRLGVYRNWEARWYADKEYTKLLHEDLAMRRLINSRLRNAGLARIETERSANQLTVVIQTAKPGIVIGKQGASVDALRDELERITGKKVRVTIHEIKNPEMDAKLVAENVAGQLEKRIAFRRAIKQSIMRTMRAGARGVRIQVSGRLGGSEMSRREWDRDGRVPLHTLRANIDYGVAEARTTFGRIGVQVWIYKGDFVTATGEPIPADGAQRTAQRDDDGDGGPAGEGPRRRPAAATPVVAEPAPERPEPTVVAAAPELAEGATAMNVDADADVDVEADTEAEDETVTVPEDSEVAPKRVPVKSKKATTARKPTTTRKPATKAKPKAGETAEEE